MIHYQNDPFLKAAYSVFKPLDPETLKVVTDWLRYQERTGKEIPVKFVRIYITPYGKVALDKSELPIYESVLDQDGVLHKVHRQTGISITALNELEERLEIQQYKDKEQNKEQNGPLQRLKQSIRAIL